MTALAAESGLFDSEFIYAAESTASGIVGRVVSVVSTGAPGCDRGDPNGSQVPWVAVWAVTTAGSYLLAYSVACGLMS